MTQLQVISDIDTWLVSLLFWAALLFPAVTALFWPWWDSPWGWNIVCLEACIAVSLLPGVLYLYFGIDAIGFRWMQAAALALVLAVIVWRGVLIWRTQRQGLD